MRISAALICCVAAVLVASGCHGSSGPDEPVSAERTTTAAPATTAPAATTPARPATDASSSASGAASSAASAAPPATTTGPSATRSTPSPNAPSTHAPSSSATSTRAPSSSVPSTGVVVVLDPGHNGANADHPSVINAPVPNGNGGTKPCNTTGTATNDGYPEHAFTWDVVLRVRAILQARGVSVVMTRDNDTGVGPCVNRRAAIGNEANATAVVSIHGDGAPSWGHGFHVIEAVKEPGGAAIAADTERLAADVHDAMIADSGLVASTYLGANGYDHRTDLAGLNLSVRPTVMVECGNMRNAGDAAIMSSPSGRQRIAAAIAAGILRYVGLA